MEGSISDNITPGSRRSLRRPVGSHTTQLRLGELCFVAEGKMKNTWTRLVLLLMLLAGPSEEFFFEYPKKALTEFFQSLKTKKQQPPKTDVQHYHIHYYPMPAPLLAWRAPDKRDLDKLYSETIRSFGWTGYRYKFAPDPSMMMMSSLQQLLDDSIPWDQDILDSESEDIQTSIDRNMKGILVKVPVNQVNQQVVLQLLKKWQKKTTI